MKDKLQRLGEKLYSRTGYRPPEDSREPITPAGEEGAPAGWESPDIDEYLRADRRAAEPYPLMRKIFIVAALFFVCASAAAALIYFKGDNFISTRNLDIAVVAPTAIAAGAPVDLEITVTNKNNAALDHVNLSIIYPEGTRLPDDPTTPLQNGKEAIDELGAGEKTVKTERAVFLGSEGEVKSVRVSVTYRVKGSNATFTKDKVFDMTIGTAPLTVSIVRPESVTSGENFDSVVTVTSNSAEVLKGVILKAEYPYGWSFTSATPQNSDPQKSLWLLGDLPPGGKRTVTLRGSLTGENEDERTFRFFVGLGKGGGAEFDTPLSSDSMVVAIRRPALNLTVSFNGDSSLEYVAPAGKTIQAVIRFKNNTPTSLLNPVLALNLSGAALDKASVTSQGGSYDSSKSLVTWNQTNSSGLESLAPGDERTAIVNFSSLGTLPAGTNQRIDLTFTLSGRPQGSNGNISVSESRSVKIASQVSLSSKALYSRGPFGNSGPIPPKAGSETTYAVDLILGNTQNDITDAQVSGVLGPNVEWLGQVHPGDSSVTYDESTRTVTWQVGTLDSGAGFSTAARELFIHLGLIPSLGQVGGTPVLLGSIVFTGTDSFTGSTVRVTNPAVTTRISSDPSYVQGDETVVK